MSLIFGATALTAVPVEAQALIAPIPPAPVVVDYREMAISIAEDYNISTTTFTNLIEGESHFKPDADNGQDRGIAQISRKFHPEVPDSVAFSPNDALQWAAGRIVDGHIDEWTNANCYSYVSLFVKLPRMALIAPNSLPSVGSVAVFNYHGVKHLGYVVELKSDGFMIKEANFKPAIVDTRFVSWQDPFLKGFWRSDSS